MNFNYSKKKILPRQKRECMVHKNEHERITPEQPAHFHQHTCSEALVPATKLCYIGNLFLLKREKKNE